MSDNVFGNTLFGRLTNMQRASHSKRNRGQKGMTTVMKVETERDRVGDRK